jgi:hypothetical protein
VHNAETAQKRIPKDKLVPLDFVEASEWPEPLDGASPEDSFHYTWVCSLLERALEEVEASCHEDGLSTHWYVFNDRVVEPLTSRTDPPPLSVICECYGIAEPSKASNMIVTVKRRFQDALRRRLRQSVLSDDGVREELGELQRFFPAMAQDAP